MLWPMGSDCTMPSRLTPVQQADLTITSPRTTPWRRGTSYANGKFYQFDARQILVMTGWPDPRAWRRTKTIDWKQVRKQADQTMRGWDMHVPEQPLVEYFLRSQFGGRAVEPASIKDSIRLSENQALLAQMRSLIGKLEDLSSPEFVWPESVPATDRYWHKVAANDLLVRSNYLRQIPHAVRGLLQSFAQGRWQMFNLLARCPGAEDLCRSNPALAFALANNWSFHQPAVAQPYRSARALVFKKQVKIADWLGFSGQKSVVRVLAKIAPECLSTSRLHFLRIALQDPATVALLGHLQIINASVLELVNFPEFRHRLTPPLLREVSELVRLDDGTAPAQHLSSDQSSFNQLASLMRDTRRMMARQPDAAHWPQQFRNIKHLQSFHDEAVEALNAGIDQLPNARFTSEPFPLPPYIGSTVIQPISTAIDLYREGQQMHHCVGIYLDDVLSGKFFAYKVTDPVRATLSICRNRDGEWVQDQAVSFANQPIPAEIQGMLYTALFAT